VGPLDAVVLLTAVTSIVTTTVNVSRRENPAVMIIARDAATLLLILQITDDEDTHRLTLAAEWPKRAAELRVTVPSNAPTTVTDTLPVVGPLDAIVLLGAGAS